MKNDLTDILDAAEAKFRLTSLSTDVEARKTACVPTGTLSLDLMLGGGIFPGLWYTVYGGEGAAKSTSIAKFMGALAHAGCSGSLYDYEGSTDPTYLANQLSVIQKLAGGKQLTADDIFGLRDPKNPSKWKKRPIFRLYTEGVGDTFFDSLASIARHMPDKVYEDGKWWYVFEEKPENGKVDAKRSSRGAYYVEAENGFPELVAFTDSYPMMYPEKLDDDDKSAGLASVARMFSENVPKVMGKLKSKGITVIGVNQLRLKPGVTHGNPEYEPGGQTVKYASSVRIHNAHLSVPHGKGPIEEEPSVLVEGNDQYKYIRVRVTKNKSATSSGLESWQRIWAADPEGSAFGFDPVWNIYDYLVMTGQAARFGSGKKRNIALQLYSVDGETCVYESDLDFMDLKALVLLEEADRIEYAKGLKMDKKTYMTYFSGSNLYNHLAAQVKAGTGLAFAYAGLSGKTSGD